MPEVCSSIAQLELRRYRFFSFMIGGFIVLSASFGRIAIPKQIILIQNTKSLCAWCPNIILQSVQPGMGFYVGMGHVYRKKSGTQRHSKEVVCRTREAESWVEDCERRL